MRALVPAIRSIVAATRLLAATRKPSKADLLDAVRYFNDMHADTDPEDGGYGREIDINELKFTGIVPMEPSDFVEDSSHLQNDSGWLKEYPEEEWAEELESAYSRDFEHLIEAYGDGTIAPGIQIDGRFADGFGRACLFDALGERMPVAQYDLAGDPDAVHFSVKEERRYDGNVIAKVGGKEVGRLHFYPEHHSQEMINCSSVLVKGGKRGQGIGTQLLEWFQGWIHARYPKVKWLTCENTSQGSLRIFTKVFGKPVKVHDGINDLDYDEAMSTLAKEGLVKVADNGFESIQGDEGYVNSIFWIGQGRMKKNPWA